MQELNDLCLLLLSSSTTMGFIRIEHHCRAIHQSVRHTPSDESAPLYSQQSMYQIAEALVAIRACVSELQLLMENRFNSRQMKE